MQVLGGYERGDDENEELEVCLISPILKLQTAVVMPALDIKNTCQHVDMKLFYHKRSVS